ncbi:hypothetical protein TRVL_09654 [Trypanosoma vivax]|nr:hypothetical protein TRVL_09654 [Trypanosoma vivax]
MLIRLNHFKEVSAARQCHSLLVFSLGVTVQQVKVPPLNLCALTQNARVHLQPIERCCATLTTFTSLFMLSGNKCTKHRIPFSDSQFFHCFFCCCYVLHLNFWLQYKEYEIVVKM